MTNAPAKKRRSLSHEILGLLAVSLIISLFLFAFLSTTASSIVSAYRAYYDISFNHAQYTTMNVWIQSVSLLTSGGVFVILFLSLLGQKLAYIQSITRGVQALRTHQMDFLMPLEGNNQLTELAESINFLAATERKMKQKEKALQSEKEHLIRTLSHDIRTPLTSILSYSEYLAQKPDLSLQETLQYASLIQKKALQIKELTDVLLEGGRRSPELIPDGRLLLEQLLTEWEEALEDQFSCVIDMRQCPPFSGSFDVQELRRIFDNLASNIKKYADPTHPVNLRVTLREGVLAIFQENRKRLPGENNKSFQIGLSSIKRIAHSYGGSVTLSDDDDRFSIEISFNNI